MPRDGSSTNTANMERYDYTGGKMLTRELQNMTQNELVMDIIEPQ